MHGGPAKAEERRVDPVTQNIQHVLDPGLPGRRYTNLAALKGFPIPEGLRHA